jgi:tetratricopeptide (TPR) repeat protein
MNYGLTQMRAGRLEAARELFVRAQQFTPNYPFLEINRGAVSGALGDTTAAEQHFLRALSLDQRLAPAHREYGRWLIERGRSPDASEHLERSITLASGDVDSRRMLMSLAAARGDSQRLRALATEALRVAGTDWMARAYAAGGLPFAPADSGAPAWLKLGFGLTGQKRHADAAQAYRAVLARDSTDADAWNNLGWSLAKLGFYDDALRAFDAAIRHRPGYDLARNNRKWAAGEVARARFMVALARERAGDYGDAILRYRELLAQYPDWAAAHFNLGYALMSLGSCAEAASEFERTLALQPSFSAAHLHLATCYGRLGRQADASRHRVVYERATGTAKPAGRP